MGKSEIAYYRCETCGNIVQKLHDSGMPLTCCGKEMTKLSPNTTDGAVEKHVPVIETQGNKVTVKVGSTAHPMGEDHMIEWIELFTNHGSKRHYLSPGDSPCACFLLCQGETVKNAYIYCNLHGLWKS